MTDKKLMTMIQKDEYSAVLAEIQRLRSEAKKYKKGYEILSCYFDSISDEQQTKAYRLLQKNGLM